jgi:hypothetical protein
MDPIVSGQTYYLYFGFKTILAFTGVFALSGCLFSAVSFKTAI